MPNDIINLSEASVHQPKPTWACAASDKEGNKIKTKTIKNTTIKYFFLLSGSNWNTLRNKFH
jgi:hypothetical protein